MDNFRALCYDLLLAGQETTGNTLSFLVLYLLLDQRVQSKLQAELDNLVEGCEELIGLSQRPQANYTNAVINEVQRLCNLLPLNLSHKTMFDVEIMDGKYFLKEGTVILPQISCLLYDEKVNGK
uniref:Cytochrome P450 n=1 Tax=Meloidogyne javanica TaxID=6303 RepID=A0A915MVY3_MELJA